MVRWVPAHGGGWSGVVVVWGGGRATRRRKLDGRSRKCKGRAKAHERSAESAGLGGPGGGGLGCAGGGGHTFYLVETVWREYALLTRVTVTPLHLR